MRVEPIELNAPDGVILRGQRWRGGDTWALLFHEAGKDLDCWQPLATRLVDRGYTVCTLDLRGHGLSDGEWDVLALGGDLEALLVYAREQKAARIAFFGAGESALPALLERCVCHLFAVICLSPGPLGAFSADDLRGGGVPRLFVFGSRDEAMEETARQLRSRAIGWTVLLRAPTTDQGTTLLVEPWKLQVEEHIIAFLEEQRHRSGTKRHELG